MPNIVIVVEKSFTDNILALPQGSDSQQSLPDEKSGEFQYILPSLQPGLTQQSVIIILTQTVVQSFFQFNFAK